MIVSHVLQDNVLFSQTDQVTALTHTAMVHILVAPHTSKALSCRH